jgi:hypothetical protein
MVARGYRRSGLARRANLHDDSRITSSIVVASSRISRAITQANPVVSSNL